VSVLDFSHTLHTVIGSDDRVGLTVNPVTSLVVVPHVGPEDQVTDGLPNVSSQHGNSRGTVTRSLALVDETGSSGVSSTITDEDHGRRNGSLRVGTEVGRDHDETQSETDRLAVDEPETDKSGPGVSLGVGQEGHETGSENTDEVSGGDTDHTAVLEFGGDDSSNEEGDHLKGSSSTVEKGCVQGAETQTLDDRTGEVGQDTVGNRRTKHGQGQHPTLDVPQSRKTLTSVEVGGLDTSTVLGDTSYGQGSVFGLEPDSVRRTIRQEKPEDETPNDGDGSQDVEDQLPSGNWVVAQSVPPGSCQRKTSLAQTRISTYP
jgi:hypothetical protein